MHEQKHNLNPNKMKRILLILTILAISLTTVGQTPSYQTAVIHANPTTLQGGIVRSWTANSAVAHFHENDIHYFAVISESSYNMSAVKFSDNYFHLYDLRVLDDYLYYCGSKRGSGVIGRIYIHDIANMAARPRVSEIAFPDLVSVNQLAAFNNPVDNIPHVAAIGERRFSSEPYIRLRTYMIDAKFDPMAIASADVMDCYINSSDTSETERLYDVVVTDKFVAFVGIITNAGFLTIRKCDKNGVLTTNTYKTLYQYNLPHYGVPYAAAMEDDKIAIAAECIISGEVSNATHVRLFDLPTMDMYAGQSMRSSTKSFINDFTYMPCDKTLLLVHVDQNGSSPDHRVVYFQPTTTPPYTTYAVTDANHRNLSYIDVFKSQFFIVGDGEIIMSHYKPCVTPSNTCIDVSTREIEKLDVYKPFGIETRPNSKRYANPIFIVSPTNLSYSVDCIN